MLKLNTRKSFTQSITNAVVRSLLAKLLVEIQKGLCINKNYLTFGKFLRNLDFTSCSVLRETLTHQMIHTIQCLLMPTKVQ